MLFRSCLAILGEGSEYARVAAEISSHGLRGRVALLGYRDDVECWIATAAVCVLASQREGLPRALVQYAVAGRPVVVADLPGADAIVKHGKTGYIVPADGLSEMADRLAEILNSPPLAQAMSSASQDLDLSPWGEKSMVSALEDVYARALGVKVI